MRIHTYFLKQLLKRGDAKSYIGNSLGGVSVHSHNLGGQVLHG